MRNNAQYAKKGYQETGLFLYRGTAALKKGYGMCYDLDYLTTDTGETATDNFGGRGLVEVQVPTKDTNNDAFAGVLTQDYTANPNARVMIVELALPGSCAFVAQAVASTINTGLITCAVGAGIAGIFGHGGFRGRGSAVPLTTLAVADEGDLPLQEITGVCTSVYDSATGLTTITAATGTPGTYMGYVDTALDASQYEAVVWGGATAADSTTERCPSGIYPVVQATGATTFTVEGDTGDGALTMNIRKKDLLRLAYLCDGPESGLCDYYIPYSGNTTTYIMMVSGVSIVLGGLTLAADDESDLADGTIDGQRKGVYMLGGLTTKELLMDITSGSTAAFGAASTVEMNTAGEWVTMTWHQFGPAASGAWLVEGPSATGVALA